MADVFKVRNNSARSVGLAGGLCIAGAGCVTPTALKDTTFKLPLAFELSEEDLFKSWRGLLKHMASIVPNKNVPELELFAPGVEKPLTEAEIRAWVAEYRSTKGLPVPKTAKEDHDEMVRALNRPEDWIERQAREAKQEDRAAQEARDAKMVENTVASVLKILDARNAPPAPPQRAEPRK